MNFIDPAQLKDATSDGPQTWGEAFGTLAATTSTAQQMIENTNSDRNVLQDIYARRIARIEQITGQKLENPMTRSEIGVPGFLQPTDRANFGVYEDQFNQRVTKLQDQYPQLATALPETVDDEKNRMLRDAEKASSAAAADPTLDPISHFTAQLLGGLRGAAHDPFQWQAAILGGGGSTGGTVAGRIGKTMLTEGLMNGGQEAVLQAASQERKKAAGLEYGLNDALANVGIAATFGALFGGTVEGGAALAKIYRMGDGGAEAATRVLDGNPLPGDVERVSKAVGVDLTPERVEQLNRSFEDRVLDEHMISPDAPPEQQRIFEAALRYAEDPDNHPPPDVVERAIADEQAGPARTLTADDYERIYGGDPDAIDDLQGVMQSESLDDAARIIDDQTRSPSAETVAPDLVAESAAPTPSTVIEDRGDTVLLKSEAGDAHISVKREDGNLKIGMTSVSKASRGQGKARQLYEDAVRLADEEGGVLRSDIVVSNDATRVYDSLARRGYDVRRNPDAVKTERGWIAPDRPGEKWVYEVRPRPDPTATVDPIAGQTIRPRAVLEPSDAEAMRLAEEQAGALAEPAIDANGNPQTLFDYIPITDRDGNVRLVSASEALEIADQGNILADLLEVCQV